MKRALAALLLLASGCKDEAKTPPAAANAPEATQHAAPSASVRPATPTADAPNPADRKDAEALFAAWLAAQNQGDYPAYQALYADRFTGVRRSGVKIRRFDRAGWMADRGRMFKKPMVIAAEALVVVAHGAEIHLFFTQTFEQGTYKDTGRKWIALERAAGGMRIAREEMLDSTLIARQSQGLGAKPGPAVKALAAGEVELGWTGKRDRLYLAPLVEAGDALLIGRASGEIGTGPVTTLDHTTDAASGSLGGVSATRAVDAARLPPALASRLGKTVQLLDEDFQPLCHATISGYSLTVTDWAPEKASGGPEEAAAALLDDAPVVVAELQMSGCPKGATWGRDVDLPTLPAVPALDRTEEAQIEKAVARATEEESPEIAVVRVAGDPSKAVVAVTGHTEDSCEIQEEYRMHLFLMTRKGKKWSAVPLASYAYSDTLRAAVDADRDGTLDVFTDRGSHRGDQSDFWQHDIAVYWPPGLGCDGCEGPDCGE